MDLINSTFWEVDRGRILAIPLGSIDMEDKVVWHYTKDGRFSVRSCYHLITKLSSERGCETTSGMEVVRWKDIWNLPVPPKIRMFIWRACVGILPYKAELFRSHLVDSPFCERCGIAVETVAHALMECRGLQEIWREEPFSLPQIDPHASMWALFQLLKRSHSPDRFHVSLVLCWKIWEGRNLEVHGEA